jgi:hypothetical protein
MSASLAFRFWQRAQSPSRENCERKPAPHEGQKNAREKKSQCKIWPRLPDAIRCKKT